MELFDALERIKHECERQQFCTNCPLGVSDGGGCGVFKNYPRNWRLQKPAKLFKEVEK
ncbi:MAG: hypothetical protein J6B02_03320 [Selenomonadales bacterium]|nr:hypothetical protein [Selenomonadales bacterium]